MSGAATGGILALRAGPKTAAKNALVGGILLALIEGLGIALSKMLTQLPQQGDPALEAGMSGSIDQGSSASGAPARQTVGLAPPLPMVAAPMGYGSTGEEVESPAPRSADVVTGSGFDTGSRFEDTSATQDPFASRTGDPYLTSAADSTLGGSGTGGAEKKGWFGRLLGRGGK